MLGVQQTHSAAQHHPTTRSAVSAATVVTASPLRAASINKKRPNVVHKQQTVAIVPSNQESQNTHAEAGDDVSSAWLDPPRDGQGGVEQRQGGKDDGPAELGLAHGKPPMHGTTNGTQLEENETEEQNNGAGEGEEGNNANGADDYTRHPSSPLSELSPAPDEDDNPNQEEESHEDEESGELNLTATSGLSANGQLTADGLSASANSVPLSSDTHATSNTSQSNNYPGNSAHQATVAAPFGTESTGFDGLPPSSPRRGTSSLPHATSTPPTSSPGKTTVENALAGPSGLGLASASPTKTDATRKFSALLELNAELFKVCQAFVASGYVPHETPEALPFSKRLENNLTWLSARVDGVKLATDLPDMDIPVLAPSVAHLSFPERVFERIRDLYAELPVVFAKDIARRNQLFASSSGTRTSTPGQRNSATPSLLPPSGIGVKRERPDSAGYSRNESPTAYKRRDTGEGKGLAGPSTPVTPGSGGTMGMHPPGTPGFPRSSPSQMTRPGSRMGSMSAGVQGLGSSDGMFSPTSISGMGVGSNAHGVANMGGLSPEAQARRQMQMRQAQAQAMMFQQQQQQQLQHQQQQHQQQTNQQHQALQHQAGMQSGNMGSPQRQSQATPSPTQQQQMMHAQAVAARQMSPPGAASGMGMNGTDGMGSNQQGGTNSSMSQSSMNVNVNGMNTNTGSNMTLNPQVIASMGPSAIQAYQVLQNPQHPMTQFLSSQMPGFSQLPMMEQMRRFQMLQQQRQMLQGQRNQQMMANQMRPPNTAASGSGGSQMQQLSPSGQQLGMAPQMQSSTSEGGMQFPGTPTSTNMPGRTSSSMGMPQQMAGMSGMPNIPNMANLNPQQRQLYLMQMQMRGASVGGGPPNGGSVATGMNPAMMNPQMLQERQRLEQQQRLALAQRHGSPLNPAVNSARDQYPPGLRSNPNQGVGISRVGRSPSVSGVSDMAGAATPRIGGRMIPGSEDYQRAVLLQQAQRNAQMQQQQQQQQGFMLGQGQGQGQGGWQNQQAQLPLSAGAWPQQNQPGFGMGSSPPNSGIQPADLMGSSRQTSATPAPMGHHSPTAPSSDFDNMMNW